MIENKSYEVPRWLVHILAWCGLSLIGGIFTFAYFAFHFHDIATTSAANKTALLAEQKWKDNVNSFIEQQKNSTHLLWQRYTDLDKRMQQHELHDAEHSGGKK